uniref:Putative transmembrane protein n=1 Tax=Toxoplasma gondii COUG TaxID=1074873 RepID=A0A2G8YAK9_TOXGO|nr:putative transmembrane protein [Toxoplasma gondii COUG]
MRSAAKKTIRKEGCRQNEKDGEKRTNHRARKRKDKEGGTGWGALESSTFLVCMQSSSPDRGFWVASPFPPSRLQSLFLFFRLRFRGNVSLVQVPLRLLARRSAPAPRQKPLKDRKEAECEKRETTHDERTTRNQALFARSLGLHVSDATQTIRAAELENHSCTPVDFLSPAKDRVSTSPAVDIRLTASTAYQQLLMTCLPGCLSNRLHLSLPLGLPMNLSLLIFLSLDICASLFLQ